MADQKYVVFQLNNELYGLPIESVERILEDQSPTRIPGSPSAMLGVFDRRGSVIPAVDMRKRFGMPDYEAVGVMVVAMSAGQRVGLRVDGVDGIYEFSEDEIQPSPDLLLDSDDDYFASVGQREDKLVVMLSPDQVLPKELAKRVAKVAEKQLAAAA